MNFKLLRVLAVLDSLGPQNGKKPRFPVWAGAGAEEHPRLPGITGRMAWQIIGWLAVFCAGRISCWQSDKWETVASLGRQCGVRCVVHEAVAWPMWSCHVAKKHGHYSPARSAVRQEFQPSLCGWQRLVAGVAEWLFCQCVCQPTVPHTHGTTAEVTAHIFILLAGFRTSSVYCSNNKQWQEIKIYYLNYLNLLIIYRLTFIY